MGYNPLIPQANDFVSKSQKDIQRNYQEISSQFSEDHIMIDQEDINRGKHRRVTYQEQSGDPVSIADEVILYTKNLSGQPELYFAPESAGTVVQLTKNGLLQPSLRVEALVVFDSQGNIIEEKAPTAEDPDRKRNIAYNVTSVVPNEALVNGINIFDNWTVNFTNNISTANYWWVFGWHLSTPGSALPNQDRPVDVQPTNNAAYGGSVTTSSLSVTGYTSQNSLSNKRSISRVKRVTLIVYTRN